MDRKFGFYNLKLLLKGNLKYIIIWTTNQASESSNHSLFYFVLPNPVENDWNHKDGGGNNHESLPSPPKQPQATPFSLFTTKEIK